MKCDRCQGRRYLRVFPAMSVWDYDVNKPDEPVQYDYVPCPECHAGEVSCCEGSYRHGQLPDKEEK